MNSILIEYNIVTNLLDMILKGLLLLCGGEIMDGVRCCFVHACE